MYNSPLLSVLPQLRWKRTRLNPRRAPVRLLIVSICNLLLILQSLPPPSHLRDGSACPGSRTSTSGHLSGSTCPTPPNWEYPGRGGHRSQSPFSSGDRAPLHPTSPPTLLLIFLYLVILDLKKNKVLKRKRKKKVGWRGGWMAGSPVTAGEWRSRAVATSPWVFPAWRGRAS